LLGVGDQNKSKLKELSLPLISNTKCRQSWPNHFHESWICTAAAYLEDACAVSTLMQCLKCKLSQVHFNTKL